MRFDRIVAILWQELFVTLHSTEVIVDIVFYPLVNVVVFGFLSLYLSGGSGNTTPAGHYVLLGMVLWQIIWIVQYSITLGSLWNVWSRNLSNMFIAPLRISEYLFAQGLSGVIKAILIVAIGGVMANVLFDFDLLEIGFLPLLLSFVSFVIFAFATGVAVLGMIFRFGTRIQALAWGLIAIFQPLSAAFYPVAVLPTGLRYIAYIFPPTLTFEAARWGMTHGHAVAWDLFGISFAENAIYFLLCAWVFLRLYRKSRDTGQFARNEA
ncbi:MAG TPA: ABC transporter permease [Magnetospirillaceae bacterium]|jgi:ABC-2 type transport system permease protein